MQRVLSFQMARGFGEPSEFITKRMCFSSLFSVAFISLLCGFLLGRFATERVIDLLEEKSRIQLAGNGLDNNENVRQSWIQRLQDNPFSVDYLTNNGSNDDDVLRIKNTLLDLQLFNRVTGNRTCIVATIQGSHEPDRYVVISGSGEGVTVVVELSKALKLLYEDFVWQPRRTIKFMISLESPDSCRAALRKHVRSKIVAYVALNIPSIGESGYFVTTGFDIVKSTILEAAIGINNLNYKNDFREHPMIIEACEESSCLAPIPRLRLDVPNAALTFVSIGSSSNAEENPKSLNYYRQSLSRVIATSVWRLSEMTLFQWDSSTVNNALIKKLETLDFIEHKESIESLVAAAREITEKTIELRDKNEHMDRTKLLEVRVANDFSVELRRALLCCDDDLRSRTDWVELQRLGRDSNTTKYILRDLLNCYVTVNEILQEDVT